MTNKLLSIMVATISLLSISLISCTTTTIKNDITSNPPGATIYSGPSPGELRYVGVTPKTETYEDIMPLWKAWYYQFKKEGYEDSEIIFVPQGPPNRGRYVHANLKPKPQKTAIVLHITSNPPGATIYSGPSPHNLRYAGITNMIETFEEINPYWKVYYYQFKKPGYEDSDIIFKSQGSINESQSVHADLKPKSKEPEIVEVKPPKTINRGTAWPMGHGYVLTCAHILGELGKATLILPDGTRIPAKIEMTDKANDIAVLKVKEAKRLPRPLILAKTKSTTGTKVFTIGYPFSASLGEKSKLTEGIINSVYGIGDDPRFYQISVPLQPGNSNGPLINMKGEVIGIVTSTLDAIKVFKFSGTLPQNVNYAIKIQYAKLLLENLSEKKEFHFSPPKGNTLVELSSQLQDSVMIIESE